MEYTKSENAIAVEKLEATDFDAMSEAGLLLDQDYVKTSAGPFRGSKMMVRLGGVSVMFETMSSGAYHRAACLEGTIGLGVCIGKRRLIVNGVEVDGEDLIVTRPGTELEIDIPKQGATFVAMSIEQTVLTSLLGPDASQGHLDPTLRETTIVHSPNGARATEGGIMEIVRAARRKVGGQLSQEVPTALLASISAGLDFDGSLGKVRKRAERNGSAATFRAARQAMSDMDEFGYEQLVRAAGSGVRSIQLAFAQHGHTTPLRYFRALKLHRVREELRRSVGDRNATIGDIASTHGFSSWSRFTQLYREQFGERPSETRARTKRQPT